MVRSLMVAVAWPRRRGGRWPATSGPKRACGDQNGALLRCAHHTGTCRNARSRLLLAAYRHRLRKWSGGPRLDHPPYDAMQIQPGKPPHGGWHHRHGLPEQINVRHSFSSTMTISSNSSTSCPGKRHGSRYLRTRSRSCTSLRSNGGRRSRSCYAVDV